VYQTGTINAKLVRLRKETKTSQEKFADKKRQFLTEKEKEVLKKAREEAQVIIKNAEDQAKANAVSIVLEGRDQGEKLIINAKKQIEQEKNKMMVEIKSEVAELVARATEKIIGEKLDSGKDRELIEKVIR